MVDIIGEHVPGRGGDRVLDGDDGFLLAQAWDESSVSGTRGRWCRGFRAAAMAAVPRAAHSHRSP